jgi:hypothetical protein
LKTLENGPKNLLSEDQLKKLRSDLEDAQNKLVTQMEVVTDQEKIQLQLQVEIEKLRGDIR